MYRIFDISLDCDIHLQELPKSDGADRIISIQLGSEDLMEKGDLHWLHEWQDSNGEVIIMCAKINSNYLLRFPNLMDFLISLSGDKIIYLPAPGVPEETIRHLILDQVIPRVLGQLGNIVLHASAVQIPSGPVIVFLGETGWGKSTLASSYYDSGSRLITDDCLLIRLIHNSIYCIPNYLGLRLYPDSTEAIFKTNKQFMSVSHYSSKKRLILHEMDDVDLYESVPVSAIFLLSDPDNHDSDDISVERIYGADELMSLIEQSFLLDVTDKQLIKRQFRTASEIIEVSPVLYRLSYPRKYEMLEEVRNTVKTIATNII